jgi:hypothetical protein
VIMSVSSLAGPLKLKEGWIEGFGMLQNGSERQAPKLSRSKFIKQSSSDSADSHPKAEPQEQRGLPYIPLRAGYRNGGYSLSHTWSRALSLATLTSRVR